MNARDQRRTVIEQVGTALNSTQLQHRAIGETAVVQVGALGAAALHIHHGADRRGGRPIAAVVADSAHRADPQDILASQLGSLLVHIREGRQHALVPRATRVFAQWMAYRGRFHSYPDADVLLPRLAARALDEYLSDRCTRCGGTGRLEVSPGGTLVRGTGRMKRNAQFRHCPVSGGCGGSGKATPSHTRRRMTLGLDLARYEAENWGGHVRAAVSWLERMQTRLRRPLTVQLERSTKRE